MAIGARALRAGKAVIECALLVKPVEKQLRMLQSRVAGIGRTFTSAGSFGIAGGGFAGLRNLLVGTLAGQALMYPVKLASKFELATAQMSVFTGSVESANDAMIELMKFSAIAAQAPEEMANQMRLLMTRDISANDSLTFIKSLAVLAAGSRDQFEELVKAFADVRSATRLNGEEMRQFKNTAFNPLTEIAKRTGESMAQLKVRMEAGKISFNEVAQALQDTVGNGGRFHGMLEKISTTLSGKFNIAMAKAKLAIKPLGDAALPQAKGAFEVVIGVIDSLANSIAKHAGWYVTLLKIGGAIVAIATSAIVFGLAWQVVGFALGGLAGSLSLVGGLLGMILNPLTLVIAALGGLSYWFLASTDSGREFSARTAHNLNVVKQAAVDSFNGIAAALRAGNIESAANVMWAGMRVIWLEGTRSLHETWMNFADQFRRITVEMIFDGLKYWRNFQIDFSSGWTNIILKTKLSYWDFINWLAHINATEEEKLNADLYTAKQKGALLNNNVQAQKALDEERNKANAEIEDARRQAQGVLDQNYNDATDKARADLRAAKEKLAATKDEAEVLAAIAALQGAGDFGIGGAFDKIAAGAAEAVKSTFKQPAAFLDTRLVAQSVGGVENQQLMQLKAINRNTARLGGGLPVV